MTGIAESETSPSTLKSLIEFIFYGNYFYGICIVAALLETVAQLNLDLNGPLFYAMTCMATLLFYNYPYARNYTAPSQNPRTSWYIRNHRWVRINQWTCSIALLLGLAVLTYQHYDTLLHWGFLNWSLLLVFPCAGLLYYGSNVWSRKYNLRKIGWLKPFIIGFVWAGMANVYPILYHNLIHPQSISFSIFNTMLFLKTCMFISMLAILFDIKDYAVDNKTQINTLIVKIGLRKTLFFVVLPLTLLGLLTFISYALVQQFSALKMLLIMVPFILLIASTISFRKRRTLLYYLVVIDGLVLVKAFFGIVAMLV